MVKKLALIATLKKKKIDKKNLTEIWYGEFN